VLVPQPRSARTRVARRIDADPTSTALLLAAPTAVDLWPGVRRVGETDGRVLVEARAAHAQAPALVSVRALPPRRTPTSYVTVFEWSGAVVPPATGRLTLAYAPTGSGAPVTHAVLELDASADERVGPDVLEDMAGGFLANLARAAETRNRAA
jgi:hypothetical protein